MGTVSIDSYSPGLNLSWKGLLYCFIGAFVTTLIFTPRAFSSDLSYFTVSYGWSFLIWVTQWYGCRMVILEVRRRMDWSQKTGQKVVMLGSIVVLYSFLAFAVVQVTMLTLVIGLSPWDSIKEVFSFGAWITLGISVSFTLFYAALGMYYRWNDARLEAEALRTEMMTYKYESLRNQLNPHFLFNTLANLSALIRHDPILAEAYVSKLSNIFRYVLDIQDQELVAMEQELNFAKEYAFIVQSRTQGAVRFSFDDVYSTEADYLLPMSVQTILENVPKHNKLLNEEPLEAHIKREGEYLIVTNPIRPKPYKEESSKLGLANLKSRYEFFQQGSLEVLNSGDRFIVRLPIIRKEAV